MALDTEGIRKTSRQGIAAMRMSCPKCGAPAGSPCVTKGGKESPFVHKARTESARTEIVEDPGSFEQPVEPTAAGNPEPEPEEVTAESMDDARLIESVAELAVLMRSRADMLRERADGLDRMAGMLTP